ncbi:hypothetical protein KEM54_002132 [Ascosphaera aggregata]|nr:hypothetical protein KEM54_002132 [Ascosphaera aggregata]
MDFLKSAVASAIAKSSSLPFILEDQVDVDDSIWTLYNATRKSDNSTCSVFSFDAGSNHSRLPLAKNALRKLRTLRHPGVVKVLDTVETESHIHIITERVQPLGWSVKRKALTPEAATWGLHAVAQTVRFVNEDAASIHGAVRLSSVFTSESGEWRLGGFDILSSVKDDEAIIYTYGSLVPNYTTFAPPEIQKTGPVAIRNGPHTAIDSFGFGVLVFQVFNGGSFRGSSDVGKTANIPSSMHKSYRRLMNANPKMRLSVSHFLEQGRGVGGFFDSTLIRLTEDIDKLGLKSEEERDEFISTLDELSDDFPEDFFKVKVLPQLLHSIEYGGGGPKVLGAIVKVGAKLSDEEYQTKITPVIVRLFGNPDRAMRVALLEQLPLMIEFLPKRIVNDKIFPQMVTGFTDQAPLVREQTVKAVLTVIEKLSDRTTNGDLLRYLAKTANDEQPGIRTNTTICLGKIARHLGQSSRAKVLVAAFGRSLRDPFVHARNAALLALAATSELFTEEDCATKVLPAVCPALVDKEKLVRDQACKTMDIYLLRVRKYTATMTDTATTANSTVVPANPRTTTSNEVSWAGWAISSFTNKFASAQGQIDPTANGGLEANAKGNIMDESSATTSRMTSPDRRFQSPIQRDSGEKTLLSAATSKLAIEDSLDNKEVVDAWDDMDENDDWGFDDSPPTEPSNHQVFSTQETSTKASNQTISETTKTLSSTTYDDGGEPDFAGWLAAQSKTKAAKALPRKAANVGGKGKPQVASSASLRKTGSGASRLTAAATATTSTPAIARNGSAQAKKTISKPEKKAVDNANDEEDDWSAWD